MRRIPPLLGMCLVACNLAYAQPAEPDSLAHTRKPFWSRVQYAVAADGQLTTGNVQRMLLGAKGLLQYADSTLDWSLAPRFLYGEQTTRRPDQPPLRTVQEREPGLDVHVGLFSPRRFYVFGFGTVEQSNLRATHLRWLAGAGGGWHIWRTATQHLTLSAALLREETDFVLPIQPSYRVFRASFRLRGRHTFFNNRLRLLHTTNYLPSLAFDPNRRFTTAVTLEAPLSRRVSFTLGAAYSYEGVVPPNVRREDSRFTLGLKVANF